MQEGLADRQLVYCVPAAAINPVTVATTATFQTLRDLAGGPRKWSTSSSVQDVEVTSSHGATGVNGGVAAGMAPRKILWPHACSADG